MTQIGLTVKGTEIISKGATGNDVVVANRAENGLWIMNTFIDSTSMFLLGEGSYISDEQYEMEMILTNKPLPNF